MYLVHLNIGKPVLTNSKRKAIQISKEMVEVVGKTEVYDSMGEIVYSAYIPLCSGRVVETYFTGRNNQYEHNCISS